MKVVVSIAVPTFNRTSCLIDALQSLINQETDFGYEIIVLDNSGHSIPEAEVWAPQRTGRDKVRYLAVPEPGLHNGRHAGAMHAQSDLLVYVDDDIIAAPGWLQAIVETFEDPAIHLVGGRSLPQYETDPPEWLEAFWSYSPDGGHSCGYLSLIDLGDTSFELDADYIWGLNFAIRKQTLEMLGGFNPDGMPWELRRYRGDGESAVTRKAKALGLKAQYQPDALVYHRISKNRLTVEYFERRAYLQGISDSFTHIRATRNVGPQPVSTNSFEWRASLQRARNIASKFLKPSAAQPPHDPHLAIKKRVRAAYQAGYRYHQQEVHRDPTLREWVLRPDYRDAGLPQALSKSSMLSTSDE